MRHHPCEKDNFFIIYTINSRHLHNSKFLVQILMKGSTIGSISRMEFATFRDYSPMQFRICTGIHNSCNKHRYLSSLLFRVTVVIRYLRTFRFWLHIPRGVRRLRTRTVTLRNTARNSDIERNSICHYLE